MNTTKSAPDDAPRRGCMITLDGIDGSGKSSVIPVIRDALQGAGHEVVVTREPGGTPLAERIREMILHEPMDPLTEAMLVFAARRENIQKVILPALRSGKTVISDRFTDATFAYQGAGRGFDTDVLSSLERHTQCLQGLGEGTGAMNTAPLPQIDGLLQPSLTLLFDVPPAIAARRLADSRQPDKFEAQNVEFFERVAAGYRARQDRSPGRFVVINGSAPREAVNQQVLLALRDRGFLAANPPPQRCKLIHKEQP